MTSISGRRKYIQTNKQVVGLVIGPCMAPQIPRPELINYPFFIVLTLNLIIMGERTLQVLFHAQLHVHPMLLQKFAPPDIANNSLIVYLMLINLK